MARAKKATDKAPTDVFHTQESVVTEVPKPKAVSKDDRIAKMNMMAKRQWDGQSASLSIIERVGRIRAGLKGHGYVDILNDLVLPLPKADYERYL